MRLSVNRIPFSVLKRKTVVIQSTAILLDVELDGSAVWLVMCLLFGVFGLLEYLVYLVSLVLSHSASGNCCFLCSSSL